MGPLHVISVINNPVRFKSRYKLYREFAKRVADAGGILHTVEMAYGKRPFELTDPALPHHYQFRGHDELWQKENLINLALARLPNDWEYVAWIDADVAFARPDWVEETVQQLQHYKVLQMFTHATDLGPRFEPIAHYIGYVYAWHHHSNCHPAYSPKGLIYHPGYAWAARRDILEEIGPLIDYAILGSGDTHMAGAFTGVVEKTFHKGMSKDYKHALLNYQRLCDKHLRQKVGYVDTHLTHYFHGAKKARGYADRWKILSDNNYSPYTDIVRGPDGLIRLTSEKKALRNGIMKYFRARDEDSTSA